MGLIPYAGFDPNENDFSGIVLEDDNRSSWGNNRQRTGIDPERAITLKNQGLSHKEIGEQLAAEVGRKPAFNSNSIATAILRFNKEALEARRKLSKD